MFVVVVVVVVVVIVVVVVEGRGGAVISSRTFSQIEKIVSHSYLENVQCNIKWKTAITTYERSLK